MTHYWLLGPQFGRNWKKSVYVVVHPMDYGSRLPGFESLSSKVKKCSKHLRWTADNVQSKCPGQLPAEVVGLSIIMLAPFPPGGSLSSPNTSSSFLLFLLFSIQNVIATTILPFYTVQEESKNNAQLWMWLVMEVNSDAVRNNIALEPGMLGPG